MQNSEKFWKFPFPFLDISSFMLKFLIFGNNFVTHLLHKRKEEAGEGGQKADTLKTKRSKNFTFLIDYPAKFSNFRNLLYCATYYFYPVTKHVLVKCGNVIHRKLHEFWREEKNYSFFQNVHYINEIDLNDCLRTIKKVHLVMPMTSNLCTFFSYNFFLHNYFESEQDKNNAKSKNKIK